MHMGWSAGSAWQRAHPAVIARLQLGMTAAEPATVSAQHQASLVGVSTAAPRDNRPLGRLASLIGDVLQRIDPSGSADRRVVDGSADAPLSAAVAECNSAIEVCLELQRDVDDRDDLVATAAEDLRRLARLLVTVDRADAPFVMRQIRRVLGRLDR